MTRPLPARLASAMSSPNDVQPQPPLLRSVQLKALIEQAQEAVKDGDINGSQAARLIHGYQERLRVLERSEKGQPLLETKYEDEARGPKEIEQALEMARHRASSSDESEPPRQFRCRPTALEVLHYHGRVMKEMGNRLLMVKDMNEMSKSDIRKAMRTACWTWYIYSRALGRERGRDFVYADSRDPLHATLWPRREMPFIQHFDRIFSTFWDLEQMDIPDQPAPQAAQPKQQMPKKQLKLIKQENKARVEVQKKEEEVKAAQTKRRNERKKRYWTKRGVELHDPVTVEQAEALRDRSVALLEEQVKSAGPDMAQSANSQVRV